MDRAFEADWNTLWQYGSLCFHSLLVSRQAARKLRLSDSHLASMTTYALCLILAASFIHASWNYLSKQAGGRTPFLWLVATISVFQRPKIGLTEIIFMTVSALIHLAYFIILQRGYRVADLSIVYPMARGTGPALSTLGAIALFGERPTVFAVAGAALIVVGVFIITSGRKHASEREAINRGISYGALTGAFIATYTLWDKRAVSGVMIHPLLLDYASQIARVVMLAPVTFRNRGELTREWTVNRWPALGVGLLNPLSFIFFLMALVHTPVSYAAPARETSILIGVIFGGRLLAEGDTGRRLVASGLMLIGIMALALG